MFRPENLFAFENFLRFLLHTTRDVTKEQGDTIPRAPNHCGGPKVTIMSFQIFQNNIFAFERPLVRTWVRQICFLPQAPSNLVTLLHIAIVWPKWRKLLTKIPAHQWQTINHKQFKTNAVDCRNHFSIENNLKVEKKACYFENKHNSSPPLKTLGVGERRGFWYGTKVFKRCPILLNYAQHIYPGGP